MSRAPKSARPNAIHRAVMALWLAKMSTADIAAALRLDEANVDRIVHPPQPTACVAAVRVDPPASPASKAFLAGPPPFRPPMARTSMGGAPKASPPRPMPWAPAPTPSPARLTRFRPLTERVLTWCRAYYRSGVDPALLADLFDLAPEPLAAVLEGEAACG